MLQSVKLMNELPDPLLSMQLTPTASLDKAMKYWNWKALS
jgi:hypothetical protein